MKRKFTLLVILSAAFIAVSIARQVTTAEAPAPIIEEPQEVPLSERPIPAVIEHFAGEYNQSAEFMLAVAECESSLREDVYGDGGAAYGVYQFHKPTFESFSKKMGETLDYESSYDQIRLAAWAFANGYESHWTCAKKVKRGA